MRSWFLAIFMALAGCSGRVAPAELPPIQPAPKEHSSLRVSVYNASHEAARRHGEDTVTGYTIMVRQAVQRSLVRAGYVLVGEDQAPFDLIAKIDVQSPSLRQAGTATMSLISKEGRVVEQFSAILELDERVDIKETGPISLVEQMGKSSRLRAFVLENPRARCETMPMGRSVIAEPSSGK